jgi:predicted amidohydrolase
MQEQDSGLSIRRWRTQGERRFFHAGSTRPIFSLGTASCSAILCREVRDTEQLLPQLGGTDLAFWPGVISWDNDPYAHPDDDVTIEIAQTCARILGSYLVQCNWPNSVNRPELTAISGSLVIPPTGKLVHQCPIDEAGISVVTVDVQDRGGAPSLAHEAAHS